MPTDFLLEKINALRNLVQNEVLQIFHHELHVEAAGGESTGNAQVDQAMRTQAQASNVVIAAAKKRLAVFEAKLKALEAELTSQQAAQDSSAQ